MLAGLAVGAALVLLATVGGALLLGGGGPRTPRRPDAPAQPLAAPPVPAGQVRVASDPPGARISLDGRDLGRSTPDLFDLRLPGPHLLELSLEGHRPALLPFDLAPGEALELDVPLEPLR